MIKFVVRNKKLLFAINKLPIVNRCFVYDFSSLNTIDDESFYNLVFSHIIVSNGLTKTTRSGRFADLDDIVVDVLKQRENESATFHDIGVSNGITSLELYDKIERTGLTVNFCISDKYAKIYYNGRSIKKFYDADGHLISVNFFFLHFSPRIGKAFFLSRWLFHFYQKKADLKKPGFKEILLLAPAVYKKIQEGEITLLEFDVFETKAASPFTFLRCLNVLMPAYFSTDRIRQGVNNLRENLAEGGHLLLGRTDAANINHATVYKKENDQLKPIKIINNGFDYNNPA
jgi:hypothetical protein